MEPQDINPGFLTPTAVKALRSLMETVRYNTQRLDQLTGQSEIDVPAKLTAYDADTGAYSWVEQWYDSDGNREDYDGGRSGNSDYMPAYAVGNGVAPEDWEFPIEVRLRPRINTALGVVYEFPWNCSCNDGGSRSGSIPGSGSGSNSGSGASSGSTYDVFCDGQPIPSVFYVTFGSDFAYMGTVEVEYDSGQNAWVSGELNSVCPPQKMQAYFYCNAGVFEGGIRYYNGAEVSYKVPDTISYDPFYADWEPYTESVLPCGGTFLFSYTATKDMP